MKERRMTMSKDKTPCVIGGCEIIIDLPCLVDSCDAIQVVFDEDKPEDKQIKIVSDSGMVALSKKQLVNLGEAISKLNK
ncbi:MAG: hypothetical protein V1684_00225 [bacterium]